MKSYTNQQNAKPRNNGPQQIILTVPMALPSNIQENVEEDILEVLAKTPFNRLSIQLTGYSKIVEPDNNDRRGQKADKTSNIGFVKDFDINKNMFNVLVFERFAKVIQGFLSPAVEIIYVDNYRGLTRISKFNLIDLDGDKKKKNKDQKPAAPTPAQQSVEKATKPIADEVPSENLTPVMEKVSADSSAIESDVSELSDIAKPKYVTQEELSDEFMKPYTSEIGPDPMEVQKEEAVEIQRTEPKPDPSTEPVGVTIGDLINQNN